MGKVRVRERVMVGLELGKVSVSERGKEERLRTTQH